MCPASRPRFLVSGPLNPGVLGYPGAPLVTLHRSFVRQEILLLAFFPSTFLAGSSGPTRGSLFIEGALDSPKGHFPCRWLWSLDSPKGHFPCTGLWTHPRVTFLAGVSGTTHGSLFLQGALYSPKGHFSCRNFRTHPRVTYLAGGSEPTRGSLSLQEALDPPRGHFPYRGLWTHPWVTFLARGSACKAVSETTNR